MLQNIFTSCPTGQVPGDQEEEDDDDEQEEATKDSSGASFKKREKKATFVGWFLFFLMEKD